MGYDKRAACREMHASAALLHRWTKESAQDVAREGIMIALKKKKIEKTLCGIIAGLFVATLPVGLAVGEENGRNRSERGIINSTKQTDKDYGKHVKIDYKEGSNHHYSIPAQRRQVNLKSKQVRQNRNSPQ
jgi:hypothetical protein